MPTVIRCGRFVPLHYNHLYLQVTNQMITASKAYITNNGANTIWDQPQQVVADKIKAVIHLNQVLNTLGSFWVAYCSCDMC